MRFARNVFVLWFLVFVMVSSVLLYSRTFSEPSELQKLGFGMCSGQPCFMGIVPGVTTWKDAIATLHTYGFQELDREQVSIASIKLKNFYVHITGAKEGIVTSVEILPLNNKNIAIPLGAIIQWVGNPCSVGFLYKNLDHTDSLTSYPSMWVDIILDTDRMTEGAFVDSILMTPRNEAAHCKSTLDFLLVEWKGFAALSRYNNNN